MLLRRLAIPGLAALAAASFVAAGVSAVQGGSGSRIAAANGEVGGVRWFLEASRPEVDVGCVVVRTDPALEASVSQLTASSAETFELPAGAEAREACGPRPGTDTESFHFSDATLLVVGGQRSSVHYVAGLLEADADVTVTFSDGTTRELVDHNGAFILVWEGDAWPTRMEGARATCALAGDSSISGADFVC